MASGAAARNAAPGGRATSRKAGRAASGRSSARSGAARASRSASSMTPSAASAASAAIRPPSAAASAPPMPAPSPATRHAGHGGAAPPVRPRHEAGVVLVPVERAARRAGEVEVGHHALVQQHMVGGSRPARRAPERSNRLAFLDDRQRPDAGNHPRSAARPRHQRHALARVGRGQEGGQVPRRRAKIARAASCPGPARGRARRRRTAPRRARAAARSRPAPPARRHHPCAFSSVCPAPTVITPGSVQPRTGIGRSSAPVARMTRRAGITPRGRPAETPISSASSRCQTWRRAGNPLPPAAEGAVGSPPLLQ